jgi:hypothetical protein
MKPYHMAESLQFSACTHALRRHAAVDFLSADVQEVEMEMEMEMVPTYLMFPFPYGTESGSCRLYA